MKSVNKVAKNLSIILIANILVTLTSVILSIIVPRYLDYINYGTWQLFILFGGYVALVHFGWIDGVFLRYAGSSYDELDVKVQKTQFWMIVIWVFIICVLGIVLSYFILDTIYWIIISFVLVSSLITIPRGFLISILQACGHVKTYSITLLISRVLYFTLVIIILFNGIDDYIFLIFAYLIADLISMIYIMRKNRRIIFNTTEKFEFNFKESFLNIKYGIKLSLSFIAGNLVIGIVKLAIEYRWGIEDFAKLSLLVSMSSIFIVFINSIGIYLVPLVKNSGESRSANYINSVDIIFTLLIAGAFVFFMPFKEVLTWVLPKYIDSLKYLVLIFPISLFESKMGIIYNVYFKANRKENAMLVINIISVGITLIFVYVTSFVVRNYSLSVMVILIVLTIRATIARVYINYSLKNKIDEAIYLPIVLTVLFVTINFYRANLSGLLIYILSFVLVLFFMNKRIKYAIKYVFLKNKEEKE